jgi:hypothetical protein
MRNPAEAAYDIAQICPNGHVANSSTVHKPELNQEHCAKCGGTSTVRISGESSLARCFG